MTSESIMNDRRASLSTHQSALTVPDTEPDEEGDSPDATDGMGSMEFAKEEDSGYYGKYPEVSGQGQIKFMFHRALLEHRIHSKYPPGRPRAPVSPNISPTRHRRKNASTCSEPAVTGRLSPRYSSLPASSATERGHGQRRQRPRLPPSAP